MMLIVLQWTHALPYNTDDVHPAYGWENIMDKSSDEALTNADSYGVLPHIEMQCKLFCLLITSLSFSSASIEDTRR